jgi:hypothetical protein
MGDTVRLNFEFPREDYPYLKMMCAAKGVSFRELATELLQNAIEEYEDLKLAKKARERLDTLNPKEHISIDKAMKEAGWDNA